MHNIEIYTPSFNNRLLNVVLLFLSFTALAFPFLYVDGLAGDALIHIIFAENAAQGHFFTFNPGEPSSGETSVAYMFLLAIIYKVFGASLVPYILKGFCFFLWYGFLYLTYQFFKRAGIRPVYAYIGMLLIGLMPGSVNNALLGMENILFADIVLIWMIYAIKWRWFIAPEGLKFKKECILGTIMGAAFWLRPEAAPFLLFALLFRYFFLVRQWNFVKLTKASIFCGMWMLFFGFALFDFHYTITGYMPFGAAEARAHLSAAQGLSFLGSPINFKFIERLGYYFPIVLLSLIGLKLTLTHIPEDKINPVVLHRKFILLFSAFVFLMFFILYSSVFSSAHLARYIIFLWPFIMIMSIYGLSRIHKASLIGKVISVGLVACLLAIYCVEGYLRMTTLGRGHLLKEIAMAPANRKAYTDEFLHKLEYKNDAKNSQIVIAQEEVQMRYFMDDRIVMRSLDGILDTELNKFYADGYYNHIGYLKSRRVNYLLEYKNYNRDSSKWSLKDLAPLKEGQMVIKDGLLFKKLSSGFTSITVL